MPLKEIIDILKTNKLKEDEFLEIVFNSLDTLSHKDLRLFIKHLLVSNLTTKYKYNPYLLNVLINKYPLRYEERTHFGRFKYDKWLEPNHVNTYCCSIFSTYGQFVFACKLDRNSVCRCIVSPQSNVYNYGINVIDPSSFLDLKEVVFLDLETTGLNPLTDDVIEIALYDPSNDKKYSRLLPLNRSKTISNEIESLTGITNDMIEGLSPITSQDLDELIDEFDLKRKKVLIWAGMNMFDAHFLATLFINTGNKNFKHLNFVSAMDVIKKFADISFNSYSKDYLAKYLNINSKGSHRALSDCKIEAEIYKTIYSKKK